MTTAEDEAPFRALLAQIAQDRGFPCANYKDGCLRRRIAVRMRACGVSTFADYGLRLRADSAEYDRLVEVLTINVTRLYRDAEVWDYLAEAVLPALWGRGDAAFTAWSAACSSGEELYTIAALLHRHATRLAQPGRLARARVIGTDIDEPSLAAARRATYVDEQFTEMPAELKSRYFGTVLSPTPATHGSSQRVAAPELRAMVRVERRDLLLESAPAAGLQLICCRNVLIYFDRASQEPLLRRFHEALAPGGILVLGKVETLLGPARALYEVVDQRQRIFRRREAA